MTQYIGGKSIKGVQQMKYHITLDTFEKICMSTHSKKGDEVRSYFLELRKFINYYKQHITDTILEKIESNEYGYMYIIVVNKNKNIFKAGRSDGKDIRKRLKQYSTGKEAHPDVKFVMLVTNQLLVENCCKLFLKEYQFRGGTELYKVDIDIIRKTIFECASTDKQLIDLKAEINNNHGNVDAYVVFDDSKIAKLMTSKPKSKSNKSKSKSKTMSKSKSNKKINTQKGGCNRMWKQRYINSKSHYSKLCTYLNEIIQQLDTMIKFRTIL
jgi:hypothetical protein